MEAFISIVQKLEEEHTDWDIYRVSTELLKRFAFEEIIFKQLARDRAPVHSDEYKHRWYILSKLLPDQIDDIGNTFPEDDLSEDEKCTMFFMMGHLVNETFREGFDDQSQLIEVPVDGTQRGSPQRTNRVTAQPREQGVVSVDGSRDQAVAISKVLNAIIASQTTNPPKASDILSEVSNKPIKDEIVDPVIGVTVADVLSLAIMTSKPGEEGLKYFGPGGDWNSTSCPTEFRLNRNTTGSTNALLRGAVDGLSISTTVKEWEDQGKRGITLSRVLRMYYSSQGLAPDVSHCKRSEVLPRVRKEKITQSTVTYYYLLFHRDSTYPPNNHDAKVGEAINNMNRALGEMDSTMNQKCSSGQSTQRDRPTCETPSNVFVVMDSSEITTDGYIEQKDVVGHLASKIDFGLGSGSLTMLRDSGNNKELAHISYNSSNPTCAVCKATWPDTQQSYSREQSEYNLLHAINKTLQNFEQATDLLPGVPSKSVVLFRFGELGEKDKNKINNAATTLRNGHRDTRLFVVGQNRDQLHYLTTEKENVLTETDPHHLAESLEKKICSVPAVFQFNRCWDHKRTTRNEDGNRYVGYVTPNSVQFWAFYPEYFLKSYNIKVKFNAQKGDITVCEKRGVQNPGFTSDLVYEQNRDRSCKTTDSSNRELIFTFDNPCDGYDVTNCPSMNFAIIGESSGNDNVGCDQPGDLKCRRLDQAQFEVSHEGISCNGCTLLKSSPILLLAFSLFYYFRNSN